MSVFSLKKTEPLCSGHLAIADKFSRSRRCPLQTGSTVLLCQRRYLLSCRPCLDIIEVEILSKSDVLENIKKGIITGFQMTFMFFLNVDNCNDTCFHNMLPYYYSTTYF